MTFSSAARPVLKPGMLALFAAVLCSGALRADDKAGLQACDTDIHRLCQPVFPDEKLVASCLVRRRAELSRACAELLANPPDGPDED